MENTAISARNLKEFHNLVKKESKLIIDAMMEGKDVSEMLVAAYLLFQKEIDKVVERVENADNESNQNNNINIQDKISKELERIDDYSQ